MPQVQRVCEDGGIEVSREHGTILPNQTPLRTNASKSVMETSVTMDHV